MFGLIGANFGELAWKALIFFESAAPVSPNASAGGQHGRAAVARPGEQRGPPVITLSPPWEQTFAEALIGDGGDRQLALEPTRLHQFVADMRGAFEQAAQAGDAPVLLTSAPIRPYVRSLVERFRAQTVVMSQNEIHPKAKLRAAGAV